MTSLYFLPFCDLWSVKAEYKTLLKSTPCTCNPLFSLYSLFGPSVCLFSIYFSFIFLTLTRYPLSLLFSFILTYFLSLTLFTLTLFPFPLWVSISIPIYSFTRQYYDQEIRSWSHTSFPFLQRICIRYIEDQFHVCFEPGQK